MIVLEDLRMIAAPPDNVREVGSGFYPELGLYSLAAIKAIRSANGLCPCVMCCQKVSRGEIAFNTRSHGSILLVAMDVTIGCRSLRYLETQGAVSSSIAIRPLRLLSPREIVMQGDGYNRPVFVRGTGERVAFERQRCRLSPVLNNTLNEMIAMGKVPINIHNVSLPNDIIISSPWENWIGCHVGYIYVDTIRDLNGNALPPERMTEPSPERLRRRALIAAYNNRAPVVASSTETKRKPVSRSAMEFTLGWELEACRKSSFIPPNVLEGYDGSVAGDSVEYKIDEKTAFDPPRSIAALHRLAVDKSIRVDRSCGFHVHVGLKRQTPKASLWAGWMVTLARIIEDDAFLAVPTSRHDNQYCRRWNGGGDIYKSIIRTYEGNKGSNYSRYYWLNVVEMFRPGGIRTCEVRLLGATRRFAYLLAWSAFCTDLGKKAWDLLYDPSLLASHAEALRESLRMIKDKIAAAPIGSLKAFEKANEYAFRMGIRAVPAAVIGGFARLLVAEDKIFIELVLIKIEEISRELARVEHDFYALSSSMRSARETLAKRHGVLKQQRNDLYQTQIYQRYIKRQAVNEGELLGTDSSSYATASF